ncbi:MAG: phosphopantothenoylcysteine decarboxylase [Leptospiraceae bacterium]|nr:phosphopantothenoylcysteine decarboxylase [Leptospiraceae bacterium]MCP5493928.1 phosphopantothenoylcysteine decarboxylase [Leptospiraceae bacterium]
MKIKKAIVSAGATREWIDPVRFISNASSGKMGFCIARELSQWIETIVYIHGITSEKYSKLENAKNIFAETTVEMKNAILSELEDFSLIVMAAAPVDFKPSENQNQKIKKESNNTLNLLLVPNPDILKSIYESLYKNQISNTILVGFAAETNDLEKNAMEKLKRKNLNYIIGNYVNKNSVGFGDVESKIKIFSNRGIVQEYGPASKELLAADISNFLKSNL